MKKLIIEPKGWPCAVSELASGFFVYNGALCLKTAYGEDAYCESGEAFWGGVNSKEQREKLLIQPVKPKWVEENE
jgi:hypothetical protein